MQYQNTTEFALMADSLDPLKDFRQRFHIPPVNGKESIYFTGNSLGLQPRSTAAYVQQELNDWAQYGVEGHFHAKNPWFSYHELFPALLAPIVGALPEEVVVMNQLTVNLHLLMVSFYRPAGKRYKILCEAKAFPSDQYALQSQVQFHGYTPEAALIELRPREGEHCVRTEDVLEQIRQHKDSLALVMIGGVNYYSGEVFDMAAITAAAHEAGALAGFDLAHAAGNIRLALHDWQVDFACWCSYKYMNSGPGGVSGVFIHQRHIASKELHRFAGWWGQKKETRFLMEPRFDPIPTAEGWQLSNAPVLSMAAHKAALDIFAEAGMDQLISKGLQLSGYLHYVLNEINRQHDQPLIEVITPTDNKARGCQVSMLMKHRGKEVFNTLMQQGVIADWREPNVIRIAPVPLYNTYLDVWTFGQIIQDVLATP
ncbi:MAG: kynureninase [Candidatus Pseudobacter hemicellulosilyticus]|uniref:Kynureninase n=1 Tax=Candidatus Pseudobacter hemicellulosilyticus TaxID=3121375 RepID=A0AAJ5WQX8_9BACT|nr:MAG: kynureninase [Pseudobacter sp.]